MAARESTPASLAQLIARRTGTRNSEPPSPSQAPLKPAPVGTQFGLLFTEPEASPPEPAPPKPERKLWSVAELVSALRGKVEREYADEWVEGEISNCRPASSGHLYFTLKDGDAQLPVVLFRRQASLLKFRPEDGMAVLVRGRVSVFESRGQLQLIAESLEPRGAGAMQFAFEQLKARLRCEGMFDSERKRPLPAFPRTIGVITSPQGAVIRDIVTVCRRRHGCLNILVFPATVQGPTCASDVIAGLRYFNRTERHRVDVIVIARGGGSAEDLWGFNDEALARAIAASDLPVVSAVGHETDFTIADFVADLRAPTPSAAAELITAGHHRVEERVQSLAARLLRAVRFQQMAAQQRFARVSAASTFAWMRDALGRRQQRVDANRFRLEAAMASRIRSRSMQLERVNAALARQDIHHRLVRAQATLDRLKHRLERCGSTSMEPRRERLRAASIRLQALSPLAVLDRGYALVFASDGTLLRSASQTHPGEQITARLATGTVQSRVTEVHDTTGNDIT